MVRIISRIKDEFVDFDFLISTPIGLRIFNADILLLSLFKSLLGARFFSSVSNEMEKLFRPRGSWGGLLQSMGQTAPVISSNAKINSRGPDLISLIREKGKNRSTGRLNRFV